MRRTNGSNILSHTHRQDTQTRRLKKHGQVIVVMRTGIFASLAQQSMTTEGPVRILWITIIQANGTMEMIVIKDTTLNTAVSNPGMTTIAGTVTEMSTNIGLETEAILMICTITTAIISSGLRHRTDTHPRNIIHIQDSTLRPRITTSTTQ